MDEPFDFEALFVQHSAQSAVTEEAHVVAVYVEMTVEGSECDSDVLEAAMDGVVSAR